MKLTINPEIHSGILRNDKSAIIGAFWYDTVDVEKTGRNRMKVSFFQYGKYSGYIIVDEVEYTKPITKLEDIIL